VDVARQPITGLEDDQFALADDMDDGDNIGQQEDPLQYLREEAWSVIKSAHNGQGLSKHDSEAVLRLVQLGVDTFKETGECLDWTRMAQVDAMTKEVLANSGDGWCEATITIPSGTFPWLAAYAPDGVTFAFEHKDMEAWLGVVYSDRNHKGHFAVEANMRFNQSNSRVYEHPWDGDLWIKYQYEARVFFEQQYYGLDPGSVAIAAVQMYSDKTSVNHKGGSMHPVRATLLNIAAGRRWEHCLYEVAMIPDMSRVLPSHLPREKRHLLKLVAINLCIAELLAPLKRLSFTGTVVLTYR
jgi:hypothetical protein